MTDIESAFKAVLCAELIGIKQAPGQVNNHDPHELTFRAKDGRIVKILIDGNCYGTICAEVVE